jgi:hypothetical protein
VWSGATGLGELALWLAGPPLLLWVAWLLTRPRMPAAVAPVGEPPALHAPAADLQQARGAQASAHERRERVT